MFCLISAEAGSSAVVSAGNSTLNTGSVMLWTMTLMLKFCLISAETMIQILKELNTSNKDLKKKVSHLEDKISKLQEDKRSKLVAPSPKVRVSKNMLPKCLHEGG